MWQDIYLMVSSVLFAVALIPSILSKDKPALWTSTFTSILLLGTTGAFFSLGLYLSAGGCALTTIAWIILLWQKFKEGDVYVKR